MTSTPETSGIESGTAEIQRVDPMDALVVDHEVARVHLSGLRFNTHAYDARGRYVQGQPYIYYDSRVQPQEAFESDLRARSLALWGDRFQDATTEQTAELLHRTDDELRALEREAERRASGFSGFLTWFTKD